MCHKPATGLKALCRKIYQYHDLVPCFKALGQNSLQVIKDLWHDFCAFFLDVCLSRIMLYSLVFCVSSDCVKTRLLVQERYVISVTIM